MMAENAAKGRRRRWLAGACALALGLTGVLAAPAAAATLSPAAPRQAGHRSATVGPNGALIAVSCPGAAACTAVGGHQTSGSTGAPLAERWNGARWAIQPMPAPAGAPDSFLTGVSCSSAGACTAVGISFTSTATRPLAERWNGTAWRIQAIPLPAGTRNADLSGVSCTSASACVAVGGYTASTGRPFDLAERWNGTRWAIQATPSLPGSAFKGLSGVSCTSARACTAAGSYIPAGGHLVTLAERWNGTRWAIQATPSPPRRIAQLAGVSCSAASACTATGYSINSAQTLFPLAEAWNGTSWHIQATPTPAGFAFFAPLPSVSCTAASACTAAGSWDNTAGNEFTLAERWNGARWVIQATPNAAPPPSASALEGVSCTSARACTAVGTFGPPGAAGRTLAERWNGTRWVIQATPNPGG